MLPPRYLPHASNTSKGLVCWVMTHCPNSTSLDIGSYGQHNVFREYYKQYRWKLTRKVLHGGTHIISGVELVVVVSEVGSTIRRTSVLEGCGIHVLVD